MLEGFVGFPAEYASRYREKGYWEDRSLRDQFADNLFGPYADRVAVIDGDVRMLARTMQIAVRASPFKLML